LKFELVHKDVNVHVTQRMGIWRRGQREALTRALQQGGNVFQGDWLADVVFEINEIPRMMLRWNIISLG